MLSRYTNADMGVATLGSWSEFENTTLYASYIEHTQASRVSREVNTCYTTYQT